MKMPVVFVGHGSPINIIEKNRFTDEWVKISKKIPRPKAILCISAHWYTRGQFVSVAEKPETIYDFYGFPEELYQIAYSAPGDPKLAKKVADLIGNVELEDRGLDHGAWSVLHFMYSDADIPVVQLSVNMENSACDSFKIGEKLKSLREEGVLIIGSGDVVHNLRLIDWSKEGGYSWADSFDEYIKEALVAGDDEKVIDYNDAEGAKKSFDYRDHFDPLLYCLGATDENDSVEVFNDERILGSLSMTCYLWS